MLLIRKRSPRCGRLASLLVVLVVAAVGCRKRGSGDASPSASSSARGDAAASASAAPAGAADPAVLAKLRTTTPCRLSAQGIGQMCKAEDELKTFVDAYAGDQLVDSCLSAIGDGDAATRFLASSCLRAAKIKSPDRPRVLKAVLARIDQESDWKLKAAMANAVGRQTSAVQAGVEDDVRAKVRAWAPDPEGVFAATGLFDTLFSLSLFGAEEPAPKTVDLAIELAGSSDYAMRESVFSTLQAAKGRSADACKALDGVVRAKKVGWGHALGFLIAIGEPCKASFEAGRTTTLEKLKAAAAPNATRADRIDVNDWSGVYRLCASPLVAKDVKEKVASAADAVATAKSADFGDKRDSKGVAAACRKKDAPRK